MQYQTRPFTVSELIEELSKLPTNAKVLIEDPDTSWTIPKFAVSKDEENVWLLPCSYQEMEK